MGMMVIESYRQFKTSSAEARVITAPASGGSHARATRPRASKEQLERVWRVHPRVRSRSGRGRWGTRCPGAVRPRSRVRLFFLLRGCSHAESVTRTQRRRCARTRARAFSRAPRALVRTSPHLHATVRAFSSRFSRSRRPPSRRRWGVQERGSQGFANRAEAHVDRRRDEVRVPRSLEVLSSIPRARVVVE